MLREKNTLIFLCRFCGGMEFIMNEIGQLLNDGDYTKVYEILFQTNDEYSLDFFCGKHLNNVLRKNFLI
jgi:hypothetical protein